MVIVRSDFPHLCSLVGAHSEWGMGNGEPSNPGSQEFWTASGDSIFPSVNMVMLLKSKGFVAVTDFLNGQPGAVLVSGPPGSGKATLVAQAASAAGRQFKIRHQWVGINASNVKA